MFQPLMTASIIVLLRVKRTFVFELLQTVASSSIFVHAASMMRSDDVHNVFGKPIPVEHSTLTIVPAGLLSQRQNVSLSAPGAEEVSNFLLSRTAFAGIVRLPPITIPATPLSLVAERSIAGSGLPASWPELAAAGPISHGGLNIHVLKLSEKSSEK